MADISENHSLEDDFERLINQIYIDNPREMLRGHFWLPPDRNRRFRDRVLVQSKVNPGANRQREWIKKFWNIPNTIPITNLMMAQTLDIMIGLLVFRTPFTTLWRHRLRDEPKKASYKLYLGHYRLRITCS